MRIALVLCLAFGAWGAVAAQTVLDGGPMPDDPPAGGDPFLGPGVTFYTDQASFAAANPGLPKEDFEEGNVAAGDGIGCPEPLDENSNDGCFSPGDILPGLQITTDSLNCAGQDIALLGDNFSGSGNVTKVVASNCGDPFILNFPGNNVTAVGLDVINFFSASDTVIDVYGIGDVLLGSDAIVAGPTGAFWGVDSTSVIIRIELNSGAAEGADNVCFGGTALPMMDGWAMVLMGLALLAAILLVVVKATRHAAPTSL